jgi:hypothetical protein
MTRTRAAIAAILCICLAGTQMVRAQGARGRPGEAWRADAEQIPIGSTVKLRMRDGERLKAVLFAVGESGITVKPATRVPESSRHISFDRLEALERYEDQVSFGKYAGVGAAIGAGVLLILLSGAAR